MAAASWRSYYEALFLPEGVEQERIPAAYRRLTYVLNADPPAGEVAASALAERAEAFVVLRDPVLRQAYDRDGSMSLGSAELESLADDEVRLTLARFGPAGADGETADPLVRAPVLVTARELVEGVRHTLPLPCRHCGGAGWLPDATRRCACAGGGVGGLARRVRGRLGGSAGCVRCLERGFTAERACPRCAGVGTDPSGVTVEVEIPAGSPPGQELRVAWAGLGDGGTPLEAVVPLVLEADPRFRMVDGEPMVTLCLTDVELSSGEAYRVSAPQGTYLVELPEDIQWGDVVRVPGAGLPTGAGRGDLLVRVVERPGVLMPTDRAAPRRRPWVLPVLGHSERTVAVFSGASAGQPSWLAIDRVAARPFGRIAAGVIAIVAVASAAAMIGALARRPADGGATVVERTVEGGSPRGILASATDGRQTSARVEDGAMTAPIEAVAEPAPGPPDSTQMGRESAAADPAAPTADEASGAPLADAPTAAAAEPRAGSVLAATNPPATASPASTESPPASAAEDAPRTLPAESGLIAGGTYTCRLPAGGPLTCWGGNERGQLGASGWALRFASASAGLAHTCALTARGAAYCWGAGGQGQLGDGAYADRATPTLVTDGPFARIAAGGGQSCALDASGAASCWGANDYGQLGDGTHETRTVPRPVAGKVRFVALGLGWSHSCGIATDGRGYCWGRNALGQLGTGDFRDRPVPAPIATRERLVAIVAGSAHTCALTAKGVALCWGHNDKGQLGDGASGRDRAQPAPVAGGLRFRELAVGSVHTCGLTVDRTIFCWGDNTHGQLGDGTTSMRTTPVPVAGGLHFLDVRASGAHSCATTVGGDDYCWGYNVEGQLGDGTRISRSKPTPVSGSGPRSTQ